MKLAALHQLEHIGETCGSADHDRDLVHELSKRLDALWRYDQYIANADGHADLQEFWRGVKRQASRKRKHSTVEGTHHCGNRKRMFLKATHDSAVEQD